jgi:hypothetical protein
MLFGVAVQQVVAVQQGVAVQQDVVVLTARTWDGDG